MHEPVEPGDLLPEHFTVEEEQRAEGLVLGRGRQPDEDVLLDGADGRLILALGLPAALSAFSAVALFIARTRAVDYSFAVTAENARAIAEIYVRLDGVSLARELAAGQVKAGLLTFGERSLP